MKKSINLYPQELRPRVEVLTVHTILVAMGFCAVAMWGVNNWFVGQNDKLSLDIAALDSEVSRKSSVLAIINAELENRTEDQRLVDISNIKERELREKLQLIDALNQRDTLKTKSFAELLNALAATPSNDLWLTNIRVIGNDLVFSGMSRTPEALPLWIASLRDHEYFSGKQFTSANMQKTDEWMRFVLRTTADGEDS